MPPPLFSRTRWRPNTCGCELEFSGGPDRPPVHIARCREHQQDDGLVVWDENRGLNRTLKILQETQGIAPETVLWTFTPRAASTGRRPLEIAVSGDVSTAQRDLDPQDQGHVLLRSTPASTPPHAPTRDGKSHALTPDGKVRGHWTLGGISFSS